MTKDELEGVEQKLEDSYDCECNISGGYSFLLSMPVAVLNLTCP